MKVAILGSGYIGSALARYFVDRRHFVTATTTSPEKIASLTQIASCAKLIRGEDFNAVEQLLREHDVLIVSVAPKKMDEYEHVYLHTAKTISAAASTQFPVRLVYLSSTSIYQEKCGNWVDETSEVDRERKESCILLDTEQAYLQGPFASVSVLRLSEIYGPGRDLPSKISRHTCFSQELGNRYTNMIHQEDIVNAVHFILPHHGIFNVTDDVHPTRQELYAQVCKQYNLPKIEWENIPYRGRYGGNKRVSNHKIKKQGYALVHPRRV